MADRLTALQELHDLAETWQGDATTIERYDASDPKAKVLRHCSESLREVLDAVGPEWVSLSIVQARTGWSLAKLRRQAGELQERGLARKTSAGEWELDREAALRIPLKEDRPDLEGLDMDEMARVLGRET